MGEGEMAVGVMAGDMAAEERGLEGVEELGEGEEALVEETAEATEEGKSLASEG